jgi:hypothetical protein
VPFLQDEMSPAEYEICTTIKCKFLIQVKWLPVTIAVNFGRSMVGAPEAWGLSDVLFYRRRVGFCEGQRGLL